MNLFEIETLNELSDEELAAVAGGATFNQQNSTNTNIVCEGAGACPGLNIKTGGQAAVKQYYNTFY
jgi:bacteriocin-like protein